MLKSKSSSKSQNSNKANHRPSPAHPQEFPSPDRPGWPSDFQTGRNRSALNIGAEGQQAAVAIFHHKLARAPRHVAQFPNELHALSRVLGTERVCVFDMEVRVQQFVFILVGIGCRRLGAAEVNGMLIARNDRVDRRILPRSQALESKFVFVVGQRAGYVGGEEQRYDLADHGDSVLQHSLSPSRWPYRAKQKARLPKQTGIFRVPMKTYRWPPPPWNPPTATSHRGIRHRHRRGIRRHRQRDRRCRG